MSTTLTWATAGLLQPGGRTSLNVATLGQLGVAGGAVLIVGSEVIPLSLTEVSSAPQVFILPSGVGLSCQLLDTLNSLQLTLLTEDAWPASLDEVTQATIVVNVTEGEGRIGVRDQPQVQVSFTIEGETLPVVLLDAGASYQVIIPGQDIWSVVLEVGDRTIVITQAPPAPSQPRLNMFGDIDWATPW